ncbi:GntR family transcriptional regulator [Terrarubrum flagellatum]|uniref:GntR family transcriptional regulator n=1 Tax=Terrirubrum flagellatum TaxID=2895980 RepID=UPI00314503C7
MDDASFNVSSRLRDALEDEILTGGLPPGARLDEASLAARFGVSRTPIREALMQLTAAGLVASQPRRGATVAIVAPNKLVEMFDVMAELEGMAVRLAARRHDDADLANIREALEACAEAAASGDADAYYYQNERFHHALYAASHHGFLIEQCVALHRRLKPYRRLQLRVRQRMATSLAEHRMIADAIAAFDGAQAEKAAREHVAVQGERFSDLIASLQQARTIAS